MVNIVHSYINTKKDLFRYFKCTGDYFVTSRLGFNWEIAGEDGVFFLNYWENINDKTTAVVVKKDEKPMIYKTEDYTLVVAIDCVKTAFIFNSVLNNNNMIK